MSKKIGVEVDNLPEKLMSFLEKMSDNKTGGKVIKEVKMKPEWLKLHNEVEDLKAEAQSLLNKAESISDEKWAKIRRDLNFPSCHLTISKDKKNVQLIEA